MRYLDFLLEEMEKYPELRGHYFPAAATQIEELRAILPEGYELPGAVIEFLGYMGTNDISSFQHNGLAIDIYLQQAVLKHLACENLGKFGDPQMPAEIFMIDEHLGSNFTFLLLSDGDDPPVYFWEEGDGGIEDSIEIFSAFSEMVRHYLNSMKMNIGEGWWRARNGIESS
jgi:hypothetical protein